VTTQPLDVTRDLPGGARLVRPDAGEPTAVRPGEPSPGVVDALALASAYAEELIVGTARDTHRAFADRIFGTVERLATGPAITGPRLLHDGIAATVYGSIALTLRAAGEGLTRLSRAGISGPPLDDSAPGRALQSAVNGLIGEKLSEEHPHLALPLTVRVGGRSVPVERTALRRAFPHATGRVLVFVHGLGEHEGIWDLKREQVGGSYGSRLEMAAGWTPVYLRVNTGMPVTHNGVSLTVLMQDLVEQWPVEVDRIALVGHSMGGLIIRAACSVTTPHERPWLDRVSDVITLGTPHLGADLARAVKHGSRFLGLTPESAGFGRILDHRSAGIRDLERGLPELPPLPHVRYRLVSAAIGSPRSPLGKLLGDLLVRRGSATGCTPPFSRKVLRLFPDADLLHVAETNHWGLLNHPEIYRAMKHWLA
jgi:pimeloyl-ACP methyl ester carboxylesterase